VAIVADGPDALAAPPKTVDAWKRLTAEANLLFGARHWRCYGFVDT
jgi:hypothetical protein